MDEKLDLCGKEKGNASKYFIPGKYSHSYNLRGNWLHNYGNIVWNCLDEHLEAFIRSSYPVSKYFPSRRPDFSTYKSDIELIYFPKPSVQRIKSKYFPSYLRNHTSASHIRVPMNSRTITKTFLCVDKKSDEHEN
ncbi:uncharacterized protein [Centruroides vittatus]|uniref:uncharacterized protein n=1 Tax=Centruroides vittatus TaxID=120091 RepID=UPI00350FC34D